VTPAELTGRSRRHIVEADPPCGLHAHVVVPFLNLRRAGLAAGFDLKPVSSFRDFDRQVGIWNAKFKGEKPLYDAAGVALDGSRLSPRERVSAILLWSALPGASRHHWGTDVDLVDANAVAPDYRVQLSAAEFAPAGPFWPMSQWLDIEAARFGFFRPYRGILSGVQPEPWHLSFAPVAEIARRDLSVGILREALEHAPLLGKDVVLAELDALHARYVAAIDWP
jgi:LAS superfamily LD-carboxypeptidase LdcB